MAMADKSVNSNDTLDNDAVRTDTAHDSVTGISAHPGTEPATGHDTKEGGILGAVGGAIVGALAGGPIGAVIGAIAGGAASAAAVNVVDKHDHDYDRTVGNTGAADTTGAYAGTTGAYADTTASTGATSANSYAATPTTGMAATGTSYNSNLSQNTGSVGANGETVIPIVEEELAVGKRQVQSGGAHIRTGVTETPVEQTVNLREEHVTVNRHAVNEPLTDTAGAFREQSFEMTETDEVPVVSKQARVVEEVVVGKTATERTQTVHDTVRRTDVEVEDLTGGGATKR